MCKSLWNNLEYTTAEPITFSGTVDNMTISNTGNIVPLSCEAGSQITGFEAPVPINPEEKSYFSGVFINDGAETITLVHNSNNSSAGNRIWVTSLANYSLLAGASIAYFYNGTHFVI